MDAISAREAAVASDPTKERINPYTKADGPPLTSPPWKVTARASQDMRTVGDKVVESGFVLVCHVCVGEMVG